MKEETENSAESLPLWRLFLYLNWLVLFAPDVRIDRVIRSNGE
ncbi:hypothetical protein ACLK2E_09580 [Escherichia coli]